MGGLAGHMSHLYDNPNLTFGQIKDIFEKSSQGKLVGTEKTDGVNLFISYSVRTGEARAARNKSNIGSGGLNASELAKKFEDRGSLTRAFVEGFGAFEEAAGSLPLEVQLDLFGPDANIFYNAEIMDPSSPNVVNYDTKSLVIHRVGHVKLDKATKEVVPFESEEHLNMLEEALDSVQDEESSEKFSVQVNAIKNLGQLSDDVSLQETLTRLDSFMGQIGAADDTKVGEYLQKTVLSEIEQVAPELDRETKILLLQRMLGYKGASVTKIKQQIPKENKELRNRVGELVSQSKNILKSAIIPLEDIVHDFSVEMLRNLESAFIIDNKSEVKRLKGEVAGAIKAIENSGNEEAMSILQKQMGKLKSVDNVSTASEGFVFDYDGNTYKFTGNFAPVNQILGLFKYGRGNVPPLQIKEEEIEIVDDRADIALLPGSFKPPHRGHMSLAQEYSKIADKLIILISDPQKSPRTLPSGDIITPEMSKEIWEIYLSNAGIHNAEAIVSPAPSPIGAVYGYLEELASSSEPIKVILGTSTKGGDEKEKYSAISKYQGTNLDVSSSPLPPLETEQGEIHASDMRKVVDELDIDALEKSFLPSGVSGEEIINIIKSQNPDPFKLEAPEEELEEISTMGSGASAGGAGSVEKRDEDKYMIHREEIIQEISFRKMIRERIKQSINKSKKSHIIYINERQRRMLDKAHLELALRKNIRKIIVEASSEVPDYGSTAKNELAALLKQIIPIMEEDYMKLQTSEEQRESFRSHLIVFTIDALNAIKSNESGPETEEEEIEEDINLKVDSPDADKFIDIGMDDEEIEMSDEEEEAGASLRTLSGHDKTGRNFAVRTFDKINSQIEDTYKALEDPSDESEFYDHLITNFKMYFDNFEGKLHAAPEEPTTDRYEKQKTSEEEPVDMSADEEVPEEVPEEAPEDLEAPPEEETLQEMRPKGWSKKKMKRYKKNFPNTKEGESLAFAMAHKQNKK